MERPFAWLLAGALSRIVKFTALALPTASERREGIWVSFRVARYPDKTLEGEWHLSLSHARYEGFNVPSSRHERSVRPVSKAKTLGQETCSTFCGPEQDQSLAYLP